MLVANKLIRFFPVLLLVTVLLPSQVFAVNQFPDQTVNGSVGLQGTITQNPPSTGATIATPANGAVFTNVPITVNGICPKNVIVKIFSNNVFVGSVFCSNGSYSLQINLFSGRNDLVARVYDSLDQSGPDSNTVTVTFNDAQFDNFGTRIALSSVYAVRGAPPNQDLTWPITLSGGEGPYAISVDWGDGSQPDLISRSTTGDIALKHQYRTAGIYRILVRATDKNGGTAFLQLIGQATGAIQNVPGKDSASQTVRVEILWIPLLAMIPLIIAAFWAGRRNELYSIRQQLEKKNEDKV